MGLCQNFGLSTNRQIYTLQYTDKDLNSYLSLSSCNCSKWHWFCLKLTQYSSLLFVRIGTIFVDSTWSMFEFSMLEHQEQLLLMIRTVCQLQFSRKKSKISKSFDDLNILTSESVKTVKFKIVVTSSAPRDRQECCMQVSAVCKKWSEGFKITRRNLSTDQVAT